MKNLKKFLILFVVLALPLCADAPANPAAAKSTTVGIKAPSIGYANFKNCVDKSKLGKREQAGFDNLKKQMDVVLEKRGKELNELHSKINDPDYMDTLSAEAEAELKHKFRTGTQELTAQESQYYQALSQANVKIIQMINEVVEKAASQVAKQNGLSIILNSEACYFCAPEGDITNLVIAEMDKIFDTKLKKESEEKGE